MKLNSMATKLITRTHIALYRRTGGKLGGRFRGSPVLLLTTTGRRSGQLRTTPLLHVVDGNRKVVVASYAGAEHHPAWYQNLLAHPEVTVQAGSSVQPMRAEVADSAERARLWPPLVAMYPTYDDYQAKTERQIPVVVLTPYEPLRSSGRSPSKGTRMPSETSAHLPTHVQNDPALSAGVSRRRFVGYLVAALTLSLAAQIAFGGLSPTMAADLEEPVITSYAWAPVRTVTADGTTYTYRELGPKGGIPVVFFMHLAGNLDNWDPRIIDPIAEHRHVIAFDNKGVGASTGRVPFTIEEAADDAYTFIKALDLDLIDVFSFSMGGMIAQDLVLKHPDLVRKLVLTGTGPRGGKDIDKVVGTTYYDIVRATLTRSDPKEYLFFNRNPAGRLAAKAFIKRLQERTVDRDKAMSVEGFQTQLMAIWRFARSAPSDLSVITQPTLIANGDNDRMVPTVLSEDLHRRIKGSELVIYPDSGHGGIFQFHEKFAPLAVEFLGR